MAEIKSTELYKRYRPRKWKNLIGQERTVKSLRGAVANDHLPTAYLFAGERGCGKTSAALLLAKAVNCPNQVDGEPCNHCDICTNIDAGAQIGVNYISMANKGSADDVREIVQQARLASPLKRQVWILDEVHNLSKQAFDSLLIPLEDERMPALFIFCTTEIKRVPPTILSRVQSRKFSLVGEDLMRRYLEAVVKKEQIEITEDQLTTVIRKGRGSVRDTLTALDGFENDEEGYTNYGEQLLEKLVEIDLAGSLAVVAEATADEATMGQELAEQLLSDMRDLLLADAGVDKSLYPSLPLEDPAAAAKKLLGIRGVSIVLDEVAEAITRMTLGADTRAHLEIALIRSVKKLKALKARMER